MYVGTSLFKSRLNITLYMQFVYFLVYFMSVLVSGFYIIGRCDD
jgi:hypothetical protein